MYQLFYSTHFKFNLFIPEYCESLEIYYDTPEIEYTFTSIYGIYGKQTNKTNGKNWYKNGSRAIWRDGNGVWFIGDTERIGESRGYAQLRDDGSCRSDSKIWSLWNGASWDNAGKKLNVRCSFWPKSGKCICKEQNRVSRECICISMFWGSYVTYTRHNSEKDNLFKKKMKRCNFLLNSTTIWKFFSCRKKLFHE